MIERVVVDLLATLKGDYLSNANTNIVDVAWEIASSSIEEEVSLKVAA